MARLIMTGMGYLCVGLGVLGAFLPVLPTTPFILLAFWLFYRSSERAKSWLLSRRVLGAIVINYYENKGIPRHAKVIALTMLWVSIGLSIIFLIDILWVRIMLGVIAVGVSVHILRQRTL
ncbi:MAG: YbaN family protein [Rikenellaceae bacterium]